MLVGLCEGCSFLKKVENRRGAQFSCVAGLWMTSVLPNFQYYLWFHALDLKKIFQKIRNHDRVFLTFDLQSQIYIFGLDVIRKGMF